MTRELIIVRHAKSAWDTGAASDFDRPLAKRGRKAAPRVGRYLRRQHLFPDYVVSSPAERARQTVLGICEQLDFDTDLINWDSRIYGGSTGSLVNVLRECPDNAKRVFIAGHNPGLEYLLLHLCDHDVPMPDDGKLLPTAAFAHLNITQEWHDLGRGSGSLLSITRARSLTED